MSNEGYHEPVEELSQPARDLHRAIVSLIEELEAVDWYSQRAEVTQDDSLRAILEHNRDEEIEHAVMTFEWIRRRYPVFDRNLRTYLFTSGEITEIEDAATESEGANGIRLAAGDGNLATGSLGIGSLRARQT